MSWLDANWWFTPLGIILPLVIHVIPIIIYRFAISKKTIEHKKAKRIAIIYGITSFILISVFSVGQAFFQTFGLYPIAFLNYFILAGIKDNLEGTVLFRYLMWRMLYGVLGVIISFFVYLNPAGDEIATSIIIIFLLLPVFVFFNRKISYKKLKEDVEAEFMWREKLKKEQEERDIDY